MTFNLPAHLTAPAPYRCAVSFHDCAVHGADGLDIQVRVYEPSAVADRTLVWAHGGSWTRGSIADWHHACLQLARLGTTRLVSVGYRLAPQWEHPTAVMDIACALRWSQRQFGGTVFVGGDSAGGTLAAGAALHCRDYGFELAGQILTYPPLDPECAAPSYSQPNQPFPPQAMLIEAWKQYAGASGATHTTKYFAPMHEDHLAGVCRTALLVGLTDPVRDDVRAFAIKLQQAAVPVHLREDPWVFHGQFLNSSEQANPVHQWIHLELNRMTSGDTPTTTAETSTP